MERERIWIWSLRQSVDKGNDMRIIDDITNFIFPEDIPAQYDTKSSRKSGESITGEGLMEDKLSALRADVIFIPGGS